MERSQELNLQDEADDVIGTLTEKAFAAGFRSRSLASHPAARMILTVHDELLFEVREDRAEDIAALVRERMEPAALCR